MMVVIANCNDNEASSRRSQLLPKLLDFYENLEQDDVPEQLITNNCPVCSCTCAESLSPYNLAIVSISQPQADYDVAEPPYDTQPTAYRVTESSYVVTVAPSPLPSYVLPPDSPYF